MAVVLVPTTHPTKILLYKNYNTYQNQVDESLTLSDFDLIQQIGSGSQGKVYLAQECRTQLICAVKQIHKQESSEILYEIFFLSFLNHPAIPKLYFYQYQNVITNERNFIATEYCPNGDLYHIIKQNGPFPQILAKSLTNQLINVLGYIHSKNVSHNDMKLENLLLDSEYCIKVIDFGYANYSSQTSTFYGGTVGYQAPEKINKIPYDSTKGDIFSLGIIIYILFMGRPPFQEAHMANSWYQLFCRDNQQFWISQQKHCQFQIPQSFIKLTNGMLNNNTNDRYNYNSLRENEWINECSSIQLDSISYKQLMNSFITQNC